MKFTDLFIRRPVLALVANILILLFGINALFSLPIRQYPLLESASISITTVYPGASAELIQGFITQPISQAVASVEGLDYISSSSTQGLSVITLNMALNSNSVTALTETMAKVNQVQYRLPREAYDPVIERSSGGTTAVAYVVFVSETMSTSALTDYLSRMVEPLFTGIEGVAKVNVLGGQTLAMRLWLDPQRLAAYNLTGSDIADAIRQNNFQAAPGQLKGQYVVTNLRVNTDLNSIQEFRDMVLRNDQGRIIRVKDVGTVELSSASTDTSALRNNTAGVALGVFDAPSANPLVIVNGIRDLLPSVQATLPPDVKVELAFEVATFIQASINEVARTLVEALIVVVLVIYLCLGNLRTVQIPAITIPLSMLGAMLLMQLFGFSLNLLTLLAMVLAIGLVVDDAIVVVENVHRHIELGKTPLEAALQGAREVAGPVVAMTLTLCAVYAPIALVGGLTGALFKEFALTLAGAVFISGIVALTLSPVMSSKLLSSKSHEGWMSLKAESFFRHLAAGYEKGLTWTLGHRKTSLSVMLIVILSLPLFYKSIQTELAPVEDQSTLLAAVKAPQHANLNYTEIFSRQLHDAFMSLPEGTSTWAINGTDGPSNSFAGVSLLSWGERKRNASDIQVELQQKVNEIEGVSIFIFSLPPLPGSTGGLPVQMVIQTDQDYQTLYEVMEQLKNEARASGLFAVVDSDLDFNSPVIEIYVDRIKANSLGVRMQDIGDVLNTLIGENYINRFGLYGRSYDVIPQSLPANRLNAGMLDNYYVRGQQNQPIPLSTLMTIKRTVEPNRLSQFNQQNAATFQAIPAQNITLGEAVGYLQQQAQQLPAGFTYDWQSDARQFVQEGSALLFTFLFALIIIYLVLAVQYESFVDPLIILISVPLSIGGALLPLALSYASLNIYTQIGLITLIGLISKHGILMVEFANEQQRTQNFDKYQAIISAGKIRLRPILMTTAAMVSGLTPLLFASGAGANSRFGLGVVIVVGMLVGTLFTLFILPTIYILLARDHRPSKHGAIV